MYVTRWIVRDFQNHQDSNQWHLKCWLDGWTGFHINPTNGCWDISQKKKEKTEGIEVAEENVAVGWDKIQFQSPGNSFLYIITPDKKQGVVKSLEVIIVEEGLLTGAGWESHFSTAAMVWCHTLHMAAIQVTRVGSQFHHNIEHFKELKQTNKQDQKNQIYYSLHKHYGIHSWQV